MPPTYRQVLDIPPVGDPIDVLADRVDHHGHVDTADYFNLSTRSATAVFAALGLSFEHTAVRGAGLFSVAQHLEYHAECLVGDRLTTHTVLLARTSRVLHGQTYLVNRTRQEVSHTSEFVSLYVDLTTRAATDFDRDVLAGIDSRLALVRDLDWTPVPPGDLFRPR